MGYRIFLAGASGAIGRRLTPLLHSAGHYVCGSTRSRANADALRSLGADPVVVDVFDACAFNPIFVFRPDDSLGDLARQAVEMAQHPTLWRVAYQQGTFQLRPSAVQIKRVFRVISGLGR